MKRCWTGEQCLFDATTETRYSTPWQWCRLRLMEAAVSDTLPMDVLLGTDVSWFDSLLGQEPTGEAMADPSAEEA